MNLTGPLAAADAYARRLMVDAAVWEKTEAADGMGGESTEWADQARTVPAQMVTPSATEREVAAQEGVEVTHTAVMPVGVDVARGHRLVISGVAYELVSDPLVATNGAVSRATAKQEPWDEPLPGGS